MQVAINKSSPSTILEKSIPTHSSYPKLAEMNCREIEPSVVTSIDSGALVKINLARLLASCGDCV